MSSKTNKLTDPIVWSNLIFVLVALLSSNPFVILAGLSLTLGSAWMHKDYNDKSHKADWGGMFFFPMVIMMFILQVPFLWIWFLVGGAFVYFYIDELTSNNGAIAILMLSAILVKVSIDLWMGLIAMVFFILFVLVNKWEKNSNHFNYVHSVKHLVGALGYTSLLISFEKLISFFS